MLSDKEFQEFHNKMWAELDPDVRSRAIAVLKQEFPETVCARIREEYTKNSATWATKYHFGWGMGVRNFLRSNPTDSIKDNELPSGNWDDYYVAAVEAAAGIRDA